MQKVISSWETGRSNPRPVIRLWSLLTTGIHHSNLKMKLKK